jgi:arylsulfatase
MSRRPNILLLYTDQQRYDTLACNGNPLAHSPNLDRLASQSVRFENFFVRAPVCVPSLAQAARTARPQVAEW